MVINHLLTGMILQVPSGKVVNILPGFDGEQPRSPVEGQVVEVSYKL